ncbi:hypothetical protein PICMEDRAFT_178225 [Pichia membranifaciens NRRL Y-2026]|uniref:RRM domain-containing protein n=1 Tax=Pichia membranifaciens NRRL Y-2026 TaxID=763406 RepID=A0A1E3NMP2_9ASCO|nr:hypothetical protein PICMEDRAFT_178225 [Pichia membranifaciens NRRL Y-2026]ODQ47371.1 hypothetical protein PICMEDRAFT_178225 [Pichia membranifaciens NRRL Y-2026]
MATITASQIPVSVPENKIKEFFSFCGKIKDIEVLDKTEKTKTIRVEFEKASAVSTALLLNGAEFEGSQIEVKEDSSSGAAAGASAGEKDVAGESGKGDSDIDQESKPKSTIIAELLANGYVLQSSLVEKAVDFDQQHGITDRFRDFISGLDQKYHLQEKNQQIANTQWGLESHWNQGVRTLNSYLDRFKKDKYGSQVHDFYTNAAKDVKSVNDEALRLAELKKKQHEGADAGAGTDADAGAASSGAPKTGAPTTVFPAINTITPDSSSAAAASFAPLEEKK